MTEYVDTHCHLNFELFEPDREVVIERAEKAGIIRILNPGIDINSSVAAVNLAQRFSTVYAAVGVHPNDALTWNKGTLQQLSELAKHPKVVAIGEIGLDYFRDYSPKDIQLQIFQEQLTLAADLQLPVIIHNRNATQDLLKVLEDWKGSLVHSGSSLVVAPGVLHSYSADFHSAKQAIELGFYIGFTGVVTFQKADELRQILRQLPMKHILTETDAPFLAPHPKRGTRNEPVFVQHIAEKMADVRGMDIDALAEAVQHNAQTIFHW